MRQLNKIGTSENSNQILFPIGTPEPAESRCRRRGTKQNWLP